MTLKDTQFRLDEDTPVKFFLRATTTRENATTTTLAEFISLCSGEYPHIEVNKYRQRLPTFVSVEEKKDYKAEHIPCVQFQQSPDGTLLPLLSIDYENCDVDIPATCIFMIFKSVGGEGACVVLRLPDEVCESKEIWESYAKRVIEYLGIDSSKRQHSIDRMRFISYDPNFIVNWYAEPFALPESIVVPTLTHSNGHASHGLEDLLPLDNNTALAAWGRLRKNLWKDMAWDALRHLPRKSDSLQTEADLKVYVAKWEKSYAHDKAQPDDYTTENKASANRIVDHVFLIRSVKASNKYAHVIKDEKNICEYYESTASGKISEPAKQKLSEILNMNKWPTITNNKLKVFYEKWIQRDTADTCYLYYQNGTLAVKKDSLVFIDGGNRAMIWKSLVLQRDYKPSTELHPICELAKKCVVNYQSLQIGLGYLMHRYWFRNMTKIVWACDHKPESDHDGRRGKDLFLKIVELCRTVTSVKWKKTHNFWTGSITPETSVVHFEDVSPYLATNEEIKRCVTGELQIEGKGRDIISRRFEDKPKFSASSQRYPGEYADESIRGRVWLVEFTNYLQTNPPKKTMVYNDSDLSSFDAWMIDCIQTYLRNKDSLVGTPEIAHDELKEALRSTYGSTVVDAVADVANVLDAQPFRILIKTVYEWCQFKENDTRASEKFQKCYHLLLRKKLAIKRIEVDGKRDRYFVPAEY